MIAGNNAIPGNPDPAPKLALSKLNEKKTPAQEIAESIQKSSEPGAIKGGSKQHCAMQQKPHRNRVNAIQQKPKYSWTHPRYDAKQHNQ